MPKNDNYITKRLKSFKYAFNGIWQTLTREPNFRIHSLAAVVVVIFGFICDLNTTEWIIIVITIGAVMSAEIFNSAIENIVDLVHPERSQQAGLIKDMAAGAVLVLAIAAAIVGFIIFIPKMIDFL